MLLRSLEVIDITAALARSAMSRTDRPDLDGAAGGGTFNATCCGAEAGAEVVLALAASAGFGVSTGLASATFTAATVFGASASFGASGAGAALAAFEATLCGSEAANRSLNIVGEIAATVAG